MKQHQNLPHNRILFGGGALGLAIFLLLGAATQCERRTAIPSHLAQRSARELNQAGLQLHEQQSFQHSAMYFEFATMQDPQFIEGYFNRARALSRAGDVPGALQSLKRAASINAVWVRNRLNHDDLAVLRSEPEFRQLARAHVATR